MLDCSEGAEGAEAASAAKVFRTETRALSFAELRGDMVCRRFFVLVMLSWSCTARVDSAICSDIHETCWSERSSILQVWMLRRLLCTTGSPATQDISTPKHFRYSRRCLCQDLGRTLGGGGRVVSCELNLARPLVEGCCACNESPVAAEVSAHVARRIINWAGAEEEVEAPCKFGMKGS